MNRNAAAHGRPVSAAFLAALACATLLASPASALEYDGTNPVNTICGDGSNPMYTLGRKAALNSSDEGDPTEILYNGVLIGTVEIRHSRKCATVWSRVKNYTGTTVQMKEALVTFTSSNGAGRVEHWYPTVDTVAPGAYGWSNQYRDRASFSAKGGIFWQGAWRYAETARTVAWVQRNANYAKNPYACNHTQAFPCKRWPVLANGNSVTRIYHVSPLLDSMPKTGGGNLDMTGDVVDMFDEFNDVPASNPFFFSGALGEHDVNVFPYFEPGVFGRAQGEDANGNGLYETGFVKMSTGVTWDSHDHARQVLCHEIDHLMGLDHVYAQDAAGIDVVGSKATCIGHWASAGPRIDDVSALDDVYSGVVP